MDSINAPARGQISSSKGKAILFIVLAVALFAGSIGCLFLYNAENERTTLKTSYISSEGERVTVDERSGYFGSRYVLTDEGRQIVLIMSVVTLLMGAGMLGLGIREMLRGRQTSNRNAAWAYTPDPASSASRPSSGASTAAPRPTSYAPRPSGGAASHTPAASPPSGSPWKKPGDL